MDELSKLIASLSPEKQKLLDAILVETSIDQEWLKASYVAPRSQKEIELVEIFERVLGVQGVGIEHSFFDLGGDSIHSIHIAAKARSAEIHISTRDIFAYPTISLLAARAQSHVDEKMHNIGDEHADSVDRMANPPSGETVSSERPEQKGKNESFTLASKAVP